MDAPFAGGRWIEVAPVGAATTIALVEAPEVGTPGVVVSLATENADDEHATLIARGVDADAEVMRMGDYVPPMFTFRDPDGNQLRVVQRD
ncbi:MAG: glyoxalase, partial [Candidatus Dormiibacterota bacterium]